MRVIKKKKIFERWRQATEWATKVFSSYLGPKIHRWVLDIGLIDIITVSHGYHYRMTVLWIPPSYRDKGWSYAY